MAVPQMKEFMMPTLGALSRMGGSGTFEDIVSTVSERMGLTESDLSQTFPRTGQKMAKRRVGANLADLKMAGAVDYLRASLLWSLTETGRAAWAEVEKNPNTAQKVAARLRAETARVKRERAEEQKASKTGAPAAAGSYEQGYSAGAEAGRSEAKLLVRHWLDAFSKGGGGAALDELRRWADE